MNTLFCFDANTIFIQTNIHVMFYCWELRLKLFATVRLTRSRGVKKYLSVWYHHSSSDTTTAWIRCGIYLLTVLSLLVVKWNFLLSISWIITSGRPATTMKHTLSGRYKLWIVTAFWFIIIDDYMFQFYAEIERDICRRNLVSGIFIRVQQPLYLGVVYQKSAKWYA